METRDTANSTHPFERAGLGLAPFVYTGMTYETYQACHGAPVQPGTSCDYCGQGIMYVCHIVAADGRKFKVGSDCVAKTHMEARILTKVERDRKAAEKTAKTARLVERLTIARAKYDADPAYLSDQPHPSEWHASNGKTLRDYVAWLLNAGDTGKTKACRIIERGTVTPLTDKRPGSPIY